MYLLDIFCFSLIFKDKNKITTPNKTTTKNNNKKTTNKNILRNKTSDWFSPVIKDFNNFCVNN